MVKPLASPTDKGEKCYFVRIRRKVGGAALNEKPLKKSKSSE